MREVSLILGGIYYSIRTGLTKLVLFFCQTGLSLEANWKMRVLPTSKYIFSLQQKKKTEKYDSGFLKITKMHII